MRENCTGQLRQHVRLTNTDSFSGGLDPGNARVGKVIAGSEATITFRSLERKARELPASANPVKHRLRVINHISADVTDRRKAPTADIGDPLAADTSDKAEEPFAQGTIGANLPYDRVVAFSQASQHVAALDHHNRGPSPAKIGSVRSTS